MPTAQVVGTAGTLRNIAFIVPAMMADPLIDMSSTECGNFDIVMHHLGTVSREFIGSMPGHPPRARFDLYSSLLTWA